MSSPKAQATAIASMLTAVFGEAPTEDESQGRTRIEATVPDSLGESARLDLLTFLYVTADRFGHRLEKNGTSRIWAEVDYESADERENQW
ncbi:hypothetical protein [Streptomyces sp. NPDC057280]|uniref:hypothetical protein n=1 Tax=Streptomyces sp. NPDC057280 TaxID=3346081 RepID=UPI00362905D6